MLLNYLYENFYEEVRFTNRLDIPKDELQKLQQQFLMPVASYSLDVQITANAFTGKHNESGSHNFYNKNYLDWHNQLQRAGIENQAQAFEYFKSQYQHAQKNFIKSDFGAEILIYFPTSVWGLPPLKDTWQHFMQGTYGLCTKRGMPNDVFAKHVLGQFITYIMANYDLKKLPTGLNQIFVSAINGLDNVTSQFAPHELKVSSRTRNIINPKTQLNFKETV